MDDSGVTRRSLTGRLALFSIALVCMVGSTIVNFGWDGGGWSAYLSLAASIALAVAVIDSVIRLEHKA